MQCYNSVVQNLDDNNVFYDLGLLGSWFFKYVERKSCQNMEKISSTLQGLMVGKRY